jgi:tRNA pseudouridine65 synthase
MTAVPATRLLAYADSSDGVPQDVAFLDKPSGLLVHSSAWAGPREHTLVDDAALLLGEGWHPLHRLDRQTSGVVAFAREGTVARWQAAMAHADKRYWALVRGHVHEAVDVDHALRDDDAPADSAPREARSRVTPLLRSEVERCSLVEVQLFSGRRHQARRHLKHISHPVIGDANHGKGPLNRAYRVRWGVLRMALHARSLAIPLDDAHRIQATAPLPDELRAPLVRLFGDDAIEALSSLRAQ